MTLTYYDVPDSSEGSEPKRGPDDQASGIFSYPSPEQRVRQDHPLRAIRRLTDEVLAASSPRFTKMYSEIGRPSIPPEQLLRALLIQSLYTVRSERFLMEEIDYSMLYRWFVGLSMDAPIWSPTTPSARIGTGLVESDIAAAFFDGVLAGLLSRTNTSQSMERCWKRGPVSRASAARTKGRRPRPTIRAIRP